MTDLINKLSKIDQRNVKLAIVHANNGNQKLLSAIKMRRGYKGVGRDE
jgi:hypothetical protein